MRSVGFLNIINEPTEVKIAGNEPFVFSTELTLGYFAKTNNPVAARAHICYFVFS
jgi:hypothetical protein